MKAKLAILLAVLMLGAGAVATLPPAPAPAQPIPAAAALETVTFAVENMTCELCPVTVKAAMAGVEGVRSVEVSLEAETATVVFDPAITNAAAIAAASANAGYPAAAQG